MGTVDVIDRTTYSDMRISKKRNHVLRERQGDGNENNSDI